MTSVFSTRFRIFRTAIVGCLLIGLAFVGGCGRGISDVKGKVRYKGKELTFGSVQIEAETGALFTGRIESDGSYTVKGVPSGKAKVMVSSVDDKFSEVMAALAGGSKSGAPPKDGGGAPNARGLTPKAGPAGDINVDIKDFSKIPLKYSDFTTSELTVDVKRGETIYDIELKD